MTVDNILVKEKQMTKLDNAGHNKFPASACQICISCFALSKKLHIILAEDGHIFLTHPELEGTL